MSSPFGTLHLLVQRRSPAARRLEAILGHLHARDLGTRVLSTQPTAAEPLTRQLLDDGARFLVAVGGDALVHAIVNGMLDLPPPEDAADGAQPVPRRPDAVLGVIDAATGGDFIRTFGLDRPVHVVARHLEGDTAMAIDVGVATYVDGSGRKAVRAFANVAQTGYGAEQVRRARRLRQLGRVGNLLAAYGAIRAVSRPATSVAVSSTATTVPLVNCVVANGQFMGSGMKVAPRALPDDGRFNVQLFTGSRSQVFLLTQRIYRGEHLPDPQIVEYQSDRVALDPQTRLRVEVDGQPVGVTPAAFRIAPLALRLKI